MRESLPIHQRRIFDLLHKQVGRVVEYSAFESVCCYKRDSGLAEVIYRLRKRGIRIENVSGVGYRLKAPRMKPMHKLDMTEPDCEFANEIQDAIAAVMTRHARDVGLESQVAILGVAIGAMLHQLPDYECEHFTHVFMRNLADAPQLSELMHVQ
jgi:hypothetical protein